ncbi:MAG: sugar phosphate isomerase/epimerase [Anaerolineales bacterium]|nr:sugar phosphate isomerase/epimerase [Anaerolineales bacterium]
MLSRPKVGVATWVFGKRPLADTLAFLGALEKLDGVELAVDVLSESAAAVQELLRQHELTLFSLVPENVDLAHPEERVRSEAMTYYRRLIDFAATVGAPRVVIRPFLGRERPLTTWADEMGWLETAVRELAAYASAHPLQLVYQVVNRYESCFINTGEAALAFLDQIEASNVYVALSSFHMNIEEQDAAGAMRKVGEKLSLLHMSDSNRRAIGQGHLKLGLHLWALQDLPHEVPIILDILPPQSNYLLPNLDSSMHKRLEKDLIESTNWF